MPLLKIESLIHSCGFYHAKAKHLKGMAKMLLRDFEGSVPNSLEKLLKLPGVGRKTANIMLVYSFNKDAIPVDTHVHRISNRFGIVKTKSPEQTELALTKIIPKRFWKDLNHAFVAYGQSICLPRNPKCADCKIHSICKRIGVKR
jgi:endonuclease-3